MTGSTPARPKGFRRDIRIACACLGSLPVLADATLHIVDVGGMQPIFTPDILSIAPGDTVAFINRGGTHNVVADDNSFRCANGCDGDSGNGSGALSNANWVAVVDFPDAGTFGYFCEAHGQPGQGMFGTIIVQAAGTTGQDSANTVPAISSLLEVGLVCALALVAMRHLLRMLAPRKP